MRVEEEKVDEINDEDMNYYGEDDGLLITRMENYGTGVEVLQPSMEGKSYESVRKHLQFTMNNDTCMKKKIQETMKEYEVTNNTDTHAYMQAELNVMFTQMHAKKVIDKYMFVMVSL